MQFDQLKRRDFIALLGGAAIAWPVAARAQQVPVIGYLGMTSPEAFASRLLAFSQGLSETGYLEGRVIIFAVSDPVQTLCDSESCSANVDFEPPPARPRNQHQWSMRWEMCPFGRSQPAAQHTKLPRPVIRHCHGCYSPLPCRVTSCKCISVRS